MPRKEIVFLHKRKIAQEEDLLLVQEEDLLLVQEYDPLLVLEEDLLLAQEKDLLPVQEEVNPNTTLRRFRDVLEPFGRFWIDFLRFWEVFGRSRGGGMYRGAPWNPCRTGWHDPG